MKVLLRIFPQLNIDQMKLFLYPAADRHEVGYTPLIVLYCRNKLKAQQVINDLYTIFAQLNKEENNKYKGTNQRPRYNAKVTDLIWVAQGNSNDKYQHPEKYTPNKVYFKSPEGMAQENYYLKFPPGHPKAGRYITDSDIE